MKFTILVICCLLTSLYAKKQFDINLGDPLSLARVQNYIDSGARVEFQSSSHLGQQRSEDDQFNDNRPGFLNSRQHISASPGYTDHKPTYRFSQNKMRNPFLRKVDFDKNKPAIEDQTQRKEKLSNGVLVSKGKRTLNFETGEYPEYYDDLIPNLI